MKQYGHRNPIALDRNGGHYMRHVAAMTEEGLHEKAAIAAELGWRDMCIATLEAELERCREQLSVEIESSKARTAHLHELLLAATAERDEFGERLFRVAELAHDRDGDTVEDRSRRLGLCAAAAHAPGRNHEALQRAAEWSGLAAQLSKAERELDDALTTLAALVVSAALTPMLTRAHIEAWRRSAHMHTDGCYGTYEPCGEHHAHDNQCGSRPLICHQRETPNLGTLCTMALTLLDWTDTVLSHAAVRSST